MNTKGTILLLIVALAVLGAIYYQNQKEEQIFTAAAIPVQIIPAVTSGTVERIIIDSPDQEAVTLTKSDGEWYTNVELKHTADANAVKAVISALDEPTTAAVVSSNPDSYAEYRVTDTSSTKLQVYEKGSAKPAVDLLVGKGGQSAFSTYVRRGGAKDVLNAQANLGMALNRDRGWRDHQIFRFSGANATRIEESGTSATFAVAKTEDDKWMFQAPETGEADSARITSLANMLASLQAEKFIESTSTSSPAEFGLEPPRQTIALTYKDHSTSPSKLTSITLLMGNKAPDDGKADAASAAVNSGGWYAKLPDTSGVFTIGTHAADALTPDPNSIKVTPPPAAPVTVDNEASTTAPETATEDSDLSNTTTSENLTTDTL